MDVGSSSILGSHPFFGVRAIGHLDGILGHQIEGNHIVDLGMLGSVVVVEIKTIGLLGLAGDPKETKAPTKDTCRQT